MGKPEQMEVRSQDAITGEGSSSSAAEIKPDSNCGEIVGSQVQLPEDILHRIHALMPMRDAAQAACVSHAFLRSWRSYPKLIISVDSLCIDECGSRYDDLTTDFITRVENIMQNHSGMGVKEFRLQSYPCSTIDLSYLDHWIQVALTAGIKEFELSLFEIGDIKYSFPCSLLSTERGSSIQSLMLSACSIRSTTQVGCTINTPMTLGKFLQLKYLEITFSSTNFSPDFDFSSLVSFLDASPALETFILRIWMPTIRHDSILEDPDGDSSQLQCLSECYHDNLKNVMITGFCSAKSMVKLTIHIMQKARSLDCLTLDTTRGHDRRFANIDRCWPLNEEALVEAGKARVAIERYIEERVPPSVNLKIIEPCSKCRYR